MARPVTVEWATAIINGSLLEGRVPLALKKTLIRLFWEKPNFMLDDKQIYIVIYSHRQQTNVLSVFQSGFRSRHGRETALVALQDDLLG